MDETEGRPPVVLKSPRMNSREDRNTPTAIDLEAGGPRKRDRDSQFGPTTPGSDEPEPSAFTEGPVVASHAAKKGRIVSRDGSLRDISTVTSGDLTADAFAPRESNEIDPDITPPGTPRICSIPASPAIAHRSDIGSTSNPTVASSNLAAEPKETPPGTPKLGANGIATLEPRSDKPENVRVKEMRERVQDMTTDEIDPSTAMPPTISAAPSPPAEDVVEEIADLPSSAAEAERENELHHTEGDVVISGPEVSSDDNHFTAHAITPLVDLPPTAPVTSSAVSNIQNAPRFVPPPSPASSLRAETGSNIGDTDYLDAQSASGRHSSSRMSSVSSLRSFANNQASGSTKLSTHHLNLHSALPKSTSSTGFDTPSDALSDISTEANPPETPHPLADSDAHSGGGASKGASLISTPDVSAPPSPAAPVLNAQPLLSKSSSVQANFGRPTSSFSPAATNTSSVGAAKAFVNPFSSFGGATASPFASSAGSASKSGFSAAPGNSSNLSTATPLVSSFGSALAASPFAAASAAGTSTFGSENANNHKEQADDDQKDKSSVARFTSPSEVQILTGEEDEYTQYQIPRAKLFILEGNDWKERGVGQLRLNTRSTGSDDKISARLLMRSEAVHRLILNISLFPEMNVTLAQDKFLRFSAFEDEKLQHYTIRCANSLVGKELYENVLDLKQMLPKRSKSSNGATDASNEV